MSEHEQKKNTDFKNPVLIAGMNTSDLKALLRGDPTTATSGPAPQAHRLSFPLHLRPRTYPAAAVNFMHTFRLGFLAVFLFILEIITGLFLMVYYVPTPEKAYPSIIRLLTEAPLGELVRDIHRLAAEAMVVVAALHLIRVFLSDSYKGKRRGTWVVGVGLLVVILGLAFTGYLLPWDQVAYWAVTIGTSIADAIPVIGGWLASMLKGGPDIGAEGLMRFYLLHAFILPIAGMALLGFHYYRVSRLHGLSLPAWVNHDGIQEKASRDAQKPVSYLPDILFQEIFLGSLVLTILIITAAFFYDAPLEHHANPRLTPLDIHAPWYFLWVQGLLKFGNTFIMGIVLPVLCLAGLCALPYINRTPRKTLRKRPLAILGCLAVLAGLAVLGYIGTPRYGLNLPPATRIIQDLAPEEGAGPLQMIPYDQLVVGIYPMDDDMKNAPAALQRFFQNFRDRLNQAAADGHMKNPASVVLIEDWQADLKRITFRIISINTDDGSKNTFERIVHRHRLTD